MNFKKNDVYSINLSGKFICILADDEYAALAPLVQHREDNGYSTKISKTAVYSNVMPVVTFEKIGYVKNNQFIKI